MAGGVGIGATISLWPLGRPALRGLTPWPPLHFVERGNVAEPICRSPTTPLFGPSLSTKWRGTEGEASEGRRDRGQRGVERHEPTHGSGNSGDHIHSGRSSPTRAISIRSSMWSSGSDAPRGGTKSGALSRRA